MADYKKMVALALEHRKNPQPGDYWHEMFSPMFIVLAADAKNVLVCDKTVPAGPDHWRFDFQHTKTLSRARFIKKLSYEYNVEGCPGNVRPGLLSEVQCWREAITLSHTYEE